VGYASPRQIRGEPALPACDLWALGVVLYELLSGAHPFERRNPFAVAVAIQNDPIDLARLPEPWRGAVGALLERDEGARPSTAAAFLEGFAPDAERFLERWAYERERAQWVRLLDERRLEGWARAARGRLDEEGFGRFVGELLAAGIGPLDRARLRAAAAAAAAAEARFQEALAALAAAGPDAAALAAAVPALEGGARGAVAHLLERERADYEARRAENTAALGDWIAARRPWRWSDVAARAAAAGPADLDALRARHAEARAARRRRWVRLAPLLAAALLVVAAICALGAGWRG
jgi:hypothetical protein